MISKHVISLIDLCICSQKATFHYFESVNTKKNYLISEFSFMYLQQQVDMFVLDNMYMFPESNLGLIQNSLVVAFI